MPQVPALDKQISIPEREIRGSAFRATITAIKVRSRCLALKSRLRVFYGLTPPTEESTRLPMTEPTTASCALNFRAGRTVPANR
jgi:hypothetical protein